METRRVSGTACSDIHDVIHIETSTIEDTGPDVQTHILHLGRRALIYRLNPHHTSNSSPKMSIRSPTAILQALTLVSLGSMTMYFKSHHDYNLQEHEARMDELEGTLRGHIGLIEESLERLEGKKSGGKGQKA
jgi:hypothetical protein